LNSSGKFKVQTNSEYFLKEIPIHLGLLCMNTNNLIKNLLKGLVEALGFAKSRGVGRRIPIPVEVHPPVQFRPSVNFRRPQLESLKDSGAFDRIELAVRSRGRLTV